MYTMARLIAALLYAGLGYYVGDLVRATFPEGVSAGYFPHAIAAFGLWQGWTVVGYRAGDGYTASMGQGFRTVIQMAFFALIFFALREMFMRSAELRYNDFGRAIMAALELFIDYLAQFAAIPMAWVTLLVAGTFFGVIVEAAKRLWR